MIDICDFAVGLSRQLYGLTIASERPGHRMMEQWHPLGPCGDHRVQFPGRGLGVERGARAGLRRSGGLEAEREDAALRRRGDGARSPRARSGSAMRPTGSSRSSRAARVGEALVDDPRIPLVSATGSTAMGRAVGPRVAQRFGRALLELGGNNAMIVCPIADLELAMRAILFAAVGTAGQRCTTLRRLIVHESIDDELVARLKRAVRQREGRRSARSQAPGRSADRRSRVRRHEGACSATTIERVDARAGRLLRPARARRDASAGRRGPQRDVRADPLCAALPRLRRSDRAQQRRAARPLLVDLHHRPARGRAVPVRGRLRLRHRQRQHRPVRRRDRRRVRRRKGDRRRPRKRLGRWKAYMRRQTNTINYGSDLPLAQGISFDVAP